MVSLDTVDGACVFSVKDTGLGIEEKRLETLFDPFTRAHSEQLKIEGNGLGLSICKKLADLLGGEIRVQSILGEGSTFTLRLPVEPPEALLTSEVLSIG